MRDAVAPESTYIVCKRPSAVLPVRTLGEFVLKPANYFTMNLYYSALCRALCKPARSGSGMRGYGMISGQPTGFCGSERTGDRAKHPITRALTPCGMMMIFFNIVCRTA